MYRTIHETWVVMSLVGIVTPIVLQKTERSRYKRHPGETALGCFFMRKKGWMHMRSDYVDAESLEHVLALLMPENRLVCRVSLQTGLRVSDVLELQTERLRQRMSVREAKTGKTKRIYLPAKLYEALQSQAGEVWVFPGRNPGKHRTRQAVWRDLHRAANALRMKDLTVSPHSMRKVYGVAQYAKNGLEGAQKALGHEEWSVTLLYAMADKITAQRILGAEKGKRKRIRKRNGSQREQNPGRDSDATVPTEFPAKRSNKAQSGSGG